MPTSLPQPLTLHSWIPLGVSFDQKVWKIGSAEGNWNVFVVNQIINFSAKFINFKADENKTDSVWQEANKKVKIIVN